MSDSIPAVQQANKVLSDDALTAASGGLSWADVGDFYVTGAKMSMRTTLWLTGSSDTSVVNELFDPLYPTRMAS